MIKNKRFSGRIVSISNGFAGESIINKTIKNYHEKKCAVFVAVLDIALLGRGRRTLPSGPSCFNMGDYDSQYWRIPALVTAADNSLSRWWTSKAAVWETCPIRFPLCREEVPITVKIGRSRLSLLRVVTVKHMATRLWYSIKRREI